jgi:hypothetical protein
MTRMSCFIGLAGSAWEGAAKPRARAITKKAARIFFMMTS